MRITLVTGRVFRAGPYLVYNPNRTRGLAFLESLVRSLPRRVWHCRIRDPLPKSLRERVLANALTSSPARHRSAIRRMNEGVDVGSRSLLHVLPLIVRLCHEETLFSVSLNHRFSQIRGLVCKEGDLHVSCRKGRSLDQVLETAAACGLRALGGGKPSTMMDIRAYRLAVKQGRVRPVGSTRTDMGTDPRTLQQASD